MFDSIVKTHPLDQKFKLIAENVNELILIVNQEYKIEYINKKSHLEILGYNDKDLIGKSMLNFIYKKDLKNIKKVLKVNLKAGEIEKEIRLKLKNGIFKRFDLDVRAFVDYKKVIKFLIILRDISEIEEGKRTKEILREVEEKFKCITEQSLMGIIILQDNKIKYINNTTADMVGYKPNEILNLPPKGFLNLIHPDDRSFVMKQAKKRQKGKRSKTTEYDCRCFKKNGDIIWIHVYSKTIKFRDKFADLITIIDITEKKQAEIKLIKSEDRLKYLLSSSPTVIYTANASSNHEFTFISENVKDLTGYNSNQFIEDSEFWISNIHPKDKEVIKKRLSKLSNKNRLGLEYRFKLKNGIYHWIRDEIKFVNNKNGTKNELIGSWTDITINKKIAEKNQHQAKLVESVMDAIISTDMNFNIITWNEAAKSIYGWKAEEVKRKNINKIIPMLGSINEQKIMLKELLKEGSWKGEVIQKMKNGTSINIMASVSMIKDNNGRDIGAVAINRDITQNKLIELKLKESEEKFRTIAEQSLLGIMIIQNGLVVFTNQAVSNIIECLIKEIKTWRIKDFLNIIHEEHLQSVITHLKTMRKNDLESIIRYQCKIITKLGNMKWIEVIAKNIIYQNDIAVIISLTDITSKKEAEAKLKQINKLKSQFLRRASHELKTPLVSIKGNLDLLVNMHNKKFDIHTNSLLNEIKYGCSRLELLIKDILETSKLEIDKIKLNKSLEDLSFLIRFSANDIRGLIVSRNHKLTIEIQERMITLFEKEKIYDVLINLLTNAINYTPPNGNIKIKSEIKGNYFIISVEDDGIGLNNEEKGKLFEKFGKIERYGQGLDVISEGTGLGLYISKKIIDLHGGDIWVESEGRNKGCTFSFSLPIIKG